MARKGKKTNSKWSLWPLKHVEVSESLWQDDLQFQFHDEDDQVSCIKAYDTNITGLFRCDDRGCQTVCWSSKRVAITIRMYEGKRYNARVYHQHCLKCNFLARPVLDDSYAERVAYRLKKWSGIPLEPPPYTKKQGPAHEREFCEGCKDGHCVESLVSRFRELTVVCRYIQPGMNLIESENG
ncbi:zinc-binding domain-containing protein [Poronia punctata]|nr:zinc-binding domain-containing protein [Poronia punctata]